MTKKRKRNLKYEDMVDILNGTIYGVNPQETVGVFLRDADKLFVQYSNLRLSLYNRYKDYLPDPTTRQELMSYIDEHFIRLVKEYDIHSPVDFPGYIKIKLGQRIWNSFIQGEYRDKERVFVTRSDKGVANLLNNVYGPDVELDYYETIEHILKGLVLNTVEKDVLFRIFKEDSDVDIKRELGEKYKNIHSDKTIGVIITDIKMLLRDKLEESMLL